MRVLSLLVLVAACGSDTLSVPITVPGRPTLFTGRTNGGAWHSFAGEPNAGTTSYTIDVDGDFELVLVCVHSNRAAVIGQVFGTYDDANVTISSWRVPDCTEPDPAVEPTISVTGQLDSTGSAAVGSRRMFTTVGDGLVFELATPPGLHDLVAYSNNAVLIDHDRQLLEDTFVGTIPVGLSGSPMLGKTFTLPVEAGEDPPRPTTTLVTRNGTEFDWGVPSIDSAIFVAPDQLGVDDVQTFDVYVDSTGAGRHARVKNFDQVPHNIELLARLQPFGVDDDDVVAHWYPIEEFYTTTHFDATAANPFGIYVNEAQVTGSKLWLEQHLNGSIASLALDTEFPGYRDEWSFAAANWILMVERWSPNELVESLTYQTYPFGR